MGAMRRNGATLQQIGDKYEVSRERVRQILDGSGVTVAQVRDARQAAEDAAAEKRKDEALDGWRRGMKLDEIARETDLTVRACNAVLERHSTELDAARRRVALNSQSRARVRRYSDEDLLSAIRRVARTLGRTPSSNDYDVVADELGLPSGVLITNRLGWSNAVHAAGLTPLASRRTSYSRRWTEEACMTSLCGVVAQLGHIPGYQEYEQLAAGRSDLPSGPTVRNRIGGWAEVRVRLALMTGR